MNRKITKVLPLCVAAFLALPFVSQHTYAAENISQNDTTSGTQYDVSDEAGTQANKKLTISVDQTVENATGVIKDFDDESQNETTPWKDLKPSIKTLEIGEGITEIGKNAFNGCTALEKADLPSTTKKIKENAFKNCSNLKEVKYMGTKKQWKDVTVEPGNDKIKLQGEENGVVEALRVAPEDIVITTNPKVVAEINPLNNVFATSETGKDLFNIDEVWTVGIDYIKTSSANWNENINNSICYQFFDKFEKGQKYRYGIRLKMNAASAAKGYKFAFSGAGNGEIKIKFKASETGTEQEKTFIPGTYTGDDNHLFNYDDIARYSVTDDGYAVLLESIADFTAEQKNAGTGSTASRPTEDNKTKETPKNEKETNVNPDLTEEKTPAKPSVKKCSVSNSAFYKTGDCATVFTLISSFFTGTLAVFGIKKKD